MCGKSTKPEKSVRKVFTLLTLACVSTSCLTQPGFASSAISTDSIKTSPITTSSAATLMQRPAYVGLRGFADLVDRVKSAVVSVKVKGKETIVEGDLKTFFDFPEFDDLPDNHPLKRFFKEFGEQYDRARNKSMHSRLRLIAQGSGFFVSKDGYVVTNNHVVKDGAAFSVVLDDGSELSAKLVGTDARTDLAVLKVNDKRAFPFVAFADDKEIRVGDWALAVGNPFGLGGTVTAGIISARGRDIGTSVYDDFIQIDAAVNRGNSGGPTFNMDGKVIGVNTAIFSPSGGSVGIAFAIPGSVANHVVQALIQKGAVDRGWVGVRIQVLNKEMAEAVGLPNAKGAIIADVDDGPAKKAGLKAGDIVLAVNGAHINDMRDLARKIADLPPHSSANFHILRDGKEHNIAVGVEAMPNDDVLKKTKNQQKEFPNNETLDSLGFTVEPSRDGVGLIVSDVTPGGAAEDNGLSVEDIILKANGIAVNDKGSLEKIIKDSKKAGRKAILLHIRTRGQNHFIALPLEQP